jgi:hypothetical protein
MEPTIQSKVIVWWYLDEGQEKSILMLIFISQNETCKMYGYKAFAKIEPVGWMERYKHNGHGPIVYIMKQ